MIDHERDFSQQTPDDNLRDDLEQLVRLAIREDLARSFDLTTIATVPEDIDASAWITARVEGVAAGFDLIPWILETIGAAVQVELLIHDSQAFESGQKLARLYGEAREVLTCERTVLNFLGRLCGIATLTREYVRRIEDLPCRVYDTRKTTPGWRRLEKYGVSCGGGRNHRSGLYDAILIKDNHLACRQRKSGQTLGPAAAVKLARDFLSKQPGVDARAIVEIEVDTLAQFEEALGATPDIILLDNMTNEQLRNAVGKRNAAEPDRGLEVQLEASGGVNLSTLRSIAETGVDRISVGALTHSAINLDLGLDWSF